MSKAEGWMSKAVPAAPDSPPPSGSTVSGKAPMPAVSPPPATLAMPPPQWPGPMRDPTGPDGNAIGGSQASDAGSVKGDSASETGSEQTSTSHFSSGTLASGASTAFLSQQVHSFTLDDFAGHEIQTILEDGETDQHQNDHLHDEDGQSHDGQQSVRPGSIVSNFEQRLDELDGLGPIEPPTREPEDPPSAAAEDPSGGGTSAIAVMEAQYLQLLQQMQYRDLTPEDLQLLKSIEKERAERHSKSPAMRVNSARQLGSWPCSSAGPSSSAA